ESDLRRTTDTRVYDIRDLLVQVPNFDNAPRFDLESVLDSDRNNRGGSGGSGTGSGGRGSSGGSSRGGIFGESADEAIEYMTREEMIQQIEEMIYNTVGRPDDWAEYGGDVSSLQEYNGNL